MARWMNRISLLAAMLLVLAAANSWSQQNPKRLIMKDGSFQAATKWEVVGQRVRYYSAERYDWEELPNDMVDWPATDKYNSERAGQRDETIKEVAKADEADEREAPLIAPGLRLPNTGGSSTSSRATGTRPISSAISTCGRHNRTPPSSSSRALLTA